MEYRYFVITLPYGFKVHLRTAVSGTLSIIPGPNVVRTKELAGLLEDRIHMNIYMGNEPQEPYPVQWRSPKKAAHPHKLLGEGLNPSRLANFVARDGLRARDYAFPATYPADVDPMPGIRMIDNCFPAVPESRIPDARNVELVSIADYLGIYEESLKLSRENPNEVFAIPGKILRRLLNLGYITDEEYDLRLIYWDYCSLDHYDELCQTRLRSGRQGYLRDGQHPWRIAEAHPPQVLPSREEVVPRREALTPQMRANLRDKLFYFFPTALYADARDIQCLEKQRKGARYRDDQPAVDRLEKRLKTLYDRKERRMKEETERLQKEEEERRRRAEERRQQAAQSRQQAEESRQQAEEGRQQAEESRQADDTDSGTSMDLLGKRALDEVRTDWDSTEGDGEEPPTKRVHLEDLQQDDMEVDTPGAGPSSAMHPRFAAHATGTTGVSPAAPLPSAPPNPPARRGRALGLMRTETFENIFEANGGNERRQHMRTTRRWLTSRDSPSPPPGPPPPAGPIIVDGPTLHVAGPEEMDMGGDTTDEEDDDAEVEQTEAQEAEAERTDTEGTDVEGSETETDMEED